MGYKMLRLPNHPNARPNGQVKRCRVIMSEHLGRPLLKTELVHHINGDKADDSLNNLVILTRAKHCREHMTGAKNPNYSSLRKKICPNCGQEYFRINCDFGKQRCCSNKCRAEYYRGERGCNTKITQETADKIKALKGIIGSRKIAFAFNISPTQVKRILRGDVW